MVKNGNIKMEAESVEIQNTAVDVQVVEIEKETFFKISISPESKQLSKPLMTQSENDF